jgi:hypothetical protein
MRVPSGAKRSAGARPDGLRVPSGAKRSLGDPERGAISALAVALFVALMVLAGLVVDGGNAINARQKIIDDAEHAARVGANQIDVGTLRGSGDVVVMWPAARSEAVSYLVGLGYDASRISVVPGGANEVVVVANDTVSTQLLSLIGIGTFDVRGQATARATVGIIQEIP